MFIDNASTSEGPHVISNVAAVYSFDSFYESITRLREASQSQIETCSYARLLKQTSPEGR